MSKLEELRKLIRWVLPMVLVACSQPVDSVAGVNMLPAGSCTATITRGACGELVFIDRPATSFSATLQVVKEERETFHSSGCPSGNPCNTVTLETSELGVDDKNGCLGEDEIFSVRVMNAETNTSLEAVSRAVGMDGSLYRIEWCAD